MMTEPPAERESSSMKLELKHLKTHLQRIYSVLKQKKGDQQELRTSSLILIASIKPAVEEVAQQVNVLLLLATLYGCVTRSKGCIPFPR